MDACVDTPRHLVDMSALLWSYTVPYCLLFRPIICCHPRSDGTFPTLWMTTSPYFCAILCHVISALLAVTCCLLYLTILCVRSSLLSRTSLVVPRSVRSFVVFFIQILSASFLTLPSYLGGPHSTCSKNAGCTLLRSRPRLGPLRIRRFSKK